MLKEEHLMILTVIIFLVPVAIFIPSFVGATQAETQSNSLIMEVNEPETIGENIKVRLENVTSTSAEISVYDTDNGGFQTHTFSEGESNTFAFENGDINVTLDSIQTSERVGITVEYPTNFGWNDSENQVNDAMPPMVILPIVIIILSVLFAVIRVGGDS